MHSLWLIVLLLIPVKDEDMLTLLDAANTSLKAKQTDVAKSIILCLDRLVSKPVS